MSSQHSFPCFPNDGAIELFVVSCLFEGQKSIFICILTNRRRFLQGTVQHLPLIHNHHNTELVINLATHRYHCQQSSHNQLQVFILFLIFCSPILNTSVCIYAQRGMQRLCAYLCERIHTYVYLKVCYIWTFYDIYQYLSITSLPLTFKNAHRAARTPHGHTCIHNNEQEMLLSLLVDQFSLLSMYFVDIYLFVLCLHACPFIETQSTTHIFKDTTRQHTNTAGITILNTAPSLFYPFVCPVLLCFIDGDFSPV